MTRFTCVEDVFEATEPFEVAFLQLDFAALLFFSFYSISSACSPWSVLPAGLAMGTAALLNATVVVPVFCFSFRDCSLYNY